MKTGIRLQAVLALLLVVTLLMPVVPRSLRAGVVASTPGNPAPHLTVIALSIGEVDLSWTDAPGPQVVHGYMIRRNDRIVATVAAPTLSYADTDVQPNTPYVYAVETIDSKGQVLSLSQPALARTPPQPDTPDTTPPSPPEGLEAVAVDRAVMLHWIEDGADDSDITACRILRNGTVLATVPVGTLTYVDHNTQLGAVYTYTLEAIDVLGQRSLPSDPAVVQVAAPAKSAPSADPSPQPRYSPSVASPMAYSGQLQRYPYLTDVVGASATVNWASTTAGASGSVSWGQVGSESCLAHSAPATKTSIIVNGSTWYQWKASLLLAANTQYCYRVYLGSTDLLGSDDSPRFWTQIPPGDTTPYRFAVFGDWGSVDSSGANPDQANLMAQIAGSGARFALATGDNSYPSGSQSNYGDLTQTGSGISAIFGPAFWTVAGAAIPLFPVIGNHGLSRSDTYHPHLLNWPQDQAVSTSNGRYVRDTYCCLNGTSSGSYPSAWYAFDAGTARFYVLTAAWPDGNTGTADVYANDYAYHWSSASAEYQWLANDLATHPTPLKFAFFHYPLYSDNSSQHSDTWLQGPSSLEGLLSSYGVDIVFNGHAHIYQRNRPAGSTGLVSYVTGGGGATLESVSNCSATDAYGIGWSYSSNQGRACGGAPAPTDLSQVFHFLLVQVNGTQVTVLPTDELGRTFDVQTYNFGPQGGTPTPAATATRPPTATGTPTRNPTVTATPPSTSTATVTPSPPAASPTVTSVPSSTPAFTPTASPSNTPSSTPTAASTTPALSPSPTPSHTPIFSDGFESGNLAAWTSSGGLTVEAALVHSGAYAAQGNTSNGGTYAKRTLAAQYNDLYARIYFTLVSYSSQVNVLRYRTAGDASLAYLFVNTAGQLGLRNDAGALTLTSSTLVGSGWHALELHATINGPASATEVWLDGTKIDALSTTMNLGTTPIGRVQIGEVNTAGRVYNVVFDDAGFDTYRIGP